MADDYSKMHQPVSDLFPAADEAGAERFRLTEQQVRSYHENGYLAGIRVLSDAQIDVLRDELSGFFEPGHPGFELWYEYHTNESSDPNTVLFHALGTWRIGAAFHDLLWNPAFTIPASQLLGGAVRFWHDQLFCKPARHGGVVAWHQDYSYWTRTKPMQHLTCWIGLDDSQRRQRVRPLCAGESQLAAAGNHRAGGRHGCDPRGARRATMGGIPASSCRRTEEG